MKSAFSLGLKMPSDSTGRRCRAGRPCRWQCWLTLKVAVLTDGPPGSPALLPPSGHLWDMHDILGFLLLVLFQCDNSLSPGKLGCCLPFLLNYNHYLFLRKSQRLLRGGRSAVSLLCGSHSCHYHKHVGRGRSLCCWFPDSQSRVFYQLCCHTCCSATGCLFGDVSFTSWVTDMFSASWRPAGRQHPLAGPPVQELGCVQGIKTMHRFLWLQAKMEHFHPSL